ncbi:SDR family oxidoreductase [Arachidicoccus ginsenosidivorans]|uniref:SDR family oxidoreductase n=1 Tax=Arachidicoccus ginsenosidivorans TaxID=496057 RepID=A0A5B8VS03_9BACT|nr:SDR family oxidoreductase [Arachidicoccus ginsenosidivorans]QEC74053.1 SDR family oxidoreductase [Arachidicoccus ginsenosidivorans]
MLLSDKVIVITGGASGIGYACVKAYIKAGAQVVVLDIQQGAMDRLIAEIGPDHLAIDCDVTKESSVKLAIEQVKDRYGRIDAIHNNAGIATPSKSLDLTTPGEWQTIMNVNLFSIYLTTKFGLPYLKQSAGCILNTSSMVASIGQLNHAAYVASKGAVDALTKAMALDYAPYKIRVNAVAPAGVWTPTLEKWAAEQPDKESIEQYLDDIHVLGYCPKGDVVADGCTFLLSDKARFITGHIMPIGGGAELGYRR